MKHDSASLISQRDSVPEWCWRSRKTRRWGKRPHLIPSKESKKNKERFSFSLKKNVPVILSFWVIVVRRIFTKLSKHISRQISFLPFEWQTCLFIVGGNVASFVIPCVNSFHFLMGPFMFNLKSVPVAALLLQKGFWM
ncbi:hypothetical protein L1987_26995 [Smallanthus sonchifolius]|uniref:Uncharacterized protein n=1 Tax=Smallanthus sonchifolius TaxID=185202 RepID=A0ACB9I9V8_9ASTR|nr:hypothetical protein L1987_26995 [Smallanthus sonchifolius]